MKIQLPQGTVEFTIKHDLNDEEGDGYIPDGYSGHVVELSLITATESRGGDALMRAFLEHELVQSADLVFLDCCPLYMDGPEQAIMQRLHTFYARYGFVSTRNDGYARMWRIQNLPECDFETDMANDLHPLLLKELSAKWSDCSFVQNTLGH